MEKLRVIFPLGQNGKHLISADPDIVDDLYGNKDLSGKESPFFFLKKRYHF